MAQPSLAFLEVDKIDIEEGFNVRTQMDEDALKDLEAQVADARASNSPCRSGQERATATGSSPATAD